MKFAFYYLAVGDEALRCLELSHSSLRQAGFTNDVYVLSNQDEVPFSVSANTKIMKLKAEHLNLEADSNKPLALFDVRKLDRENPRNVRNPRKWTICRSKTLIDKYISFDDYDYVVYLDVDVLAHGPVETMDAFLTQHKGSIITAENQEGQYLGGRGNFSFRKLKRVKTYSAANLSVLELFRHWFTKAICSDIVCIPGDENGKKLMQAWRDECLKNIDYDQPALQAVLLRLFKDIHIRAPRSLFGYGPRHTTNHQGKELQKVNSVFAHFGGAIKDPGIFKTYYDKYIKI